MSLEQEIRTEIENIKKLKLSVGEINNHLSSLEGVCREDMQKKIDAAYQRGLSETSSSDYQHGYEDGYKNCLAENDFDQPCTSCDAYKRGLEDGRKVGIKDGMCEAWEAASKIFGREVDGGLSIDELKKAFGSDVYCTADIIRTNTAEQAIAKLKAYEEKQKEDDSIEVGDIVERYIDGKLDSKSIYLQEDGGYWSCLFYTGGIFMTFAYPKGQFKKTGKHYDIASILEAMRNDR